jgi:hypothetical protein
LELEVLRSEKFELRASEDGERLGRISGFGTLYAPQNKSHSSFIRALELPCYFIPPYVSNLSRFAYIILPKLWTGRRRANKQLEVQ